MSLVKFPKKGEIVMWCIIGFIFGLMLSWLCVKVVLKNGNFQINDNDPNKDVYTLIIDDFNKVHKRKYLLLRITRK